MKTKFFQFRLDQRDRRALTTLAAYERLPVAAVLRRLVWSALERKHSDHTEVAEGSQRSHDEAQAKA